MIGGVMLVLSFALLTQRRSGAAIGLYAAQAAAMAAAAAWQAYQRDSADLWLAALIALGAKGVALPVFLRRVAGRPGEPRPAMPLATAVWVGFGVALTVLAVGAMARAELRANLAAALSVFLLGLLIMVARRSALMQAIGLLSVDNGVLLAAVAVPGAPAAELSVATLALAALVVATGRGVA